MIVDLSPDEARFIKQVLNSITDYFARGSEALADFVLLYRGDNSVFYSFLASRIQAKLAGTIQQGGEPSKVLTINDIELKFLKRLLDLYFHSIDTSTGLRSEAILNDFPGAEAIMVPDGLLRKVERASEGG
jgi:hypothetical protein